MASFLVLLSFIIATNIWVITQTNSEIISLSELNNKWVVLVLGTSRYAEKGKLNRYFTERMKSASEIYHQGNAKHILVSGDNSSKYYNEPQQMTKALMDLDIVRDDITLDYAGFRTFDSIVRAKKVFGQDSLLIVTQRFHCYRALFIAKHHGIKVKAIAAGHNENAGINILIREILARSLAILDIYVLGKEPKFLGGKEELPI